MKKLLWILFAVFTIESAAIACLTNPDGTITRCQDNTCETLKAIEAQELAPRVVKFNPCNGCEKVFTSTQLRVCSACRDVRYCSRECQVADWKKTHKKTCTPGVRVNKNPLLKISSFEQPSNMSGSVVGISSAPSRRPVLSEEYLTFVRQLMELPLDSILDYGEGEAACKAIGQSAFDYFKEKKCGNSLLAFKDLQAIVQEIHFTGADGQLRMQYVERAFAGVGDETKEWMP